MSYGNTRTRNFPRPLHIGDPRMAARQRDREWEAFEAGFQLRGELDAAIEQEIRRRLGEDGPFPAPPRPEQKKEIPFYKTKFMLGDDIVNCEGGGKLSGNIFACV
jgi:hypothetical protein